MTKTPLEKLENHSAVDKEAVKEYVKLGRIQNPEGVVKWVDNGVEFETAVQIAELPCDVPAEIGERIAKLGRETLRYDVQLTECMPVTCSLCHDELYKLPHEDYYVFVNDSGEWMSSWIRSDITPPEDVDVSRYLPVEYICDESSIDAALVEVDGEKEGVVCGVCNENGTGLSIDASVKKYVRAFHGKHQRVTQFSQIPTTSVVRHDWHLLNEKRNTSRENLWSEVGDVFPFGGQYSMELFEAYTGLLDVSFREYLNDENWGVIAVDDVFTYGDDVDKVITDIDTVIFDDEKNNSGITHGEERQERQQIQRENDVKYTMAHWGERETAISGIEFPYAVNKAREIWCHEDNRLRILDQLLMECLENVDKTTASLAYEERINEKNTPGTSEAMRSEYYDVVKRPSRGGK